MKSGVSCSRPTCPSVSGRPSFPTPPPPSPSSIAWSTTPTSLRLTGIAIGGALPRPSASRRGRRPRTDGQPVQIPALFHVAQQDTEAVTSRGPRQAHLEGFDLHANVWVGANDRAGLERLARYVLRPPFAQERLRL